MSHTHTHMYMCGSFKTFFNVFQPPNLITIPLCLKLSLWVILSPLWSFWWHPMFFWVVLFFLFLDGLHFQTTFRSLNIRHSPNMPIPYQLTFFYSLCIIVPIIFLIVSFWTLASFDFLAYLLRASISTASGLLLSYSFSRQASVP